MTSTTNTETAAAHKIQIPAGVKAEFLKPADLEIDGNVRQNFNLDDHPEERESIATYGVQNPIKAIEEPDGRVTVIDGQIRTLIALLVGIEKVPVWLEPAPDATEKQRKIDRITKQLNLNDRRIALTRGDRARGMAELLQLGLSVTRVAKVVQETDLDKVRQAGRAGRSATACKLIDDNQLDFEQAAILADYDNHGDTEAVERLLRAPRHYFAYEARLIAQERADARARFEATLPYAAFGFAVLTDMPEHIGLDGEFLPAYAVRADDDSPLTPDTLRADAEHWFVYLDIEEHMQLVDKETGEPVDSDTVDWRTERNPEQTPAEGKRHADSVEERDVWAPRYFIPTAVIAEAGYHPFVEPDTGDDTTAETEPGDTVDHSTSEKNDDPDAARALEQARAERQAREEDARKAREEAEREAQRLNELRKALNKQFAAATDARREFVRNYLHRGTVPPMTVRFILEALINNRGLFDDYEGTKLALQLLGIEGWRAELLDAIDKARPGRYAVILLGLALGACESRIAKEAWNHKDNGNRRYLHFLAELGHHLVPTEQAAAGDIDPMTIDIS